MISTYSVPSYVYDAEGRLSQVGSSVCYIYDGEGDRVAESNCNVVNGGAGNVHGITSEYLYDIDHRLVDQIVVSGTASLGYSRANIYAGGEYLGEDAPDSLVKTPSATASMLRITDQVGSLRSRWDLAGNMVTECTSFPYGEGYSCAGATPPTLYTGKERDAESGLDYFGARYYGSSMGRFLSPDWDEEPSPVPYAYLANPQSLNLYSYMRNNPLSGRDGDGHHQECDPDKPSSSVVNGVQTVTVTAGACHEVADPPQQQTSLFQRFMNWRQQQADAWNARIAVNQKYALPDNALDKDFYAALGLFASLGGMDITNAGSQFPNRELDMTQSELGAKLESEGFTKGTTKDGSTQYTRDTPGGKEEVTMYSKRTSTGVPGGQVKVGGEIVGKLSFKP